MISKVWVGGSHGTRSRHEQNSTKWVDLKSVRELDNNKGCLDCHTVVICNAIATPRAGEGAGV